MGLEDERKVTILSIDGGGVHGVFPAVLLESLEEYLKMELENEGKGNEDVRIADYFDVIAGTGIGSLIAAMLCKPTPSKMSDILTTLEDITKNAFPDDFQKSYIERFKSTISAACSLYTSIITGYIMYRRYPYEAWEKYWERSWQEQDRPIAVFTRKLDECLGETPLDKTVTNLVVPAFNFNSARPMVFSSYAYTQHQLKEEEEDEGKILLKDVVLGSSATPSVLPFHDMQENEYLGLSGKFADGSIIANNPSLLALQEGAMIYGSEAKFKNYMVLSLGTVRRTLAAKLFSYPLIMVISLVNLIIQHMTSINLYTDIIAGLLQYMYIFFNGITELYMSRLFPKQSDLPVFPSNYLRLQAYVSITRSVPSMLNGSKEAFNYLTDLAEDTFKKKAKITHPNAGDCLKLNITNEDALKEFAKRLHKQKKIKDQYKK